MRPGALGIENATLLAPVLWLRIHRVTLPICRTCYFFIYNSPNFPF
jgi:hypothetical protein